MKYFVALVILLSACAGKDNYNPDDHFSAEEKNRLVDQVVRYAAKPPKGVTAAERMEDRFNDYYQEEARKMRLEMVARKDDYYFFLISQAAPSISEKRNATGGRLKLDDKNVIAEYEEVFRTWKLNPDTLKRRAEFLFRKMVNGESLANYYSNVTGDQYVEFPDDRTYFDAASREWRLRQNQ
jgi:hypothetical protein